MKTLSELMALSDEAFAQGVYDGFSSDTPLEQDMEFALFYQELLRFPMCIACDGFDSIYYQIVIPSSWPDFERRLEMIGAQRYASLLRRGRRLYFGGDYLPANNQEWAQFKSPVWAQRDSDAAREFDRVATEAEEAYHSDSVVRKLGAYMRSHWNEIFKPKSEPACEP